jgi:hypothetical protein
MFEIRGRINNGPKVGGESTEDQPGTDVMILKIVSPIFWRKMGVSLLKALLFLQNFDHSIYF